MNHSLEKFVYLSILAALATISLKAGAYFLTGSVGLLSDALESVINLLAAMVALFAIRLAQKPPDEIHTYGHSKAEYFSSIFEGTLIFLAAIGIAFVSINRIFSPRTIEQVGIGLFITGVASVINFIIASKLLDAGKKFGSITLEADGKHLLTDVWTSAGVIIGVGIVALTGITILDPIVALFVAANIVFTGYKIIKRSFYGFMDTALPIEERKIIENVLKEYKKTGVKYHSLLSRQSGFRKFVSLHVLVPGKWQVKKSHDLMEEIEEKIRGKLLNAHVITHLEPLEDSKSFEDIEIDRN